MKCHGMDCVRHVDRQSADKQANRLSHSQSDKQTDTQTGRQTGPTFPLLVEFLARLAPLEVLLFQPLEHHRNRACQGWGVDVGVVGVVDEWMISQRA